MRIENSFTLNLPVEEVWGVLLDVERTAPCLPDVELQEITGDQHRGVVAITLGGVSARYEGSVRFAEIDEAGRRLVLEAEGREAEGGGDALASVTVTLGSAGDGRTEVAVDAELTLGGAIADLDPSVLADATSELLAGFGRCIEGGPVQEAVASAAAPSATVSEIVADEVAEMAVDDPERASQFVAAVAPAAPSAPSSPRTAQSQPATPAALPAVAAPSVAQRALPAALVGVFLLQGVVKGRLRRLGLAVLGSALVAGMVSGKQKR